MKKKKLSIGHAVFYLGLGVATAFIALAILRYAGFDPTRPVVQLLESVFG